MHTPSDIQRAAEKKYLDFLRSLVTKEDLFPLQIRFGKPNATDDFAKLKHEITELANGNFGYTIEWEERNTRRWGEQRIPLRVKFETREQFIMALGKRREVARFEENLNLTLQRIPALKDWVAAHTKWAVEFEAVWEGLIAVCEYFLAYPRPGLYARQLPIPVHTKFVLENQQVLASMLNHILPTEAKSDVSAFEERFGLKPLEPLIRFRVLDATLQSELGLSHPQMGLPLEAFRSVKAGGLTVIITENLMNFECLPTLPRALAIWGQGNAADILHRVGWLDQCKIFYWGDIDEHGFQILGRLRIRFPFIRSLNMDFATLERFCCWIGKGEKAGREPSSLTADEAAAYERVKRDGIRLEQEKIPQEFALLTLRNEGLG